MDQETEAKKWLVNDRDCRGCRYYMSLNGWKYGRKYCAYTYYTNHVRKNPPASCEVKDKTRRLAAR